MPELGKYAAEVGIAYAAGLAMIIGLVLFCVWRARRVRSALRALEERRTGDG